MKNLLTVLPDKYSEKDIVSTMMGVIIDYVPISQNRSLKPEEQVLWLKFEDRELTTTLIHPSLGYLLMLSIGTCSHFYFWGLMDGGEATLLYGERNKCTVDAKLLPNICIPNDDNFFTSRPILALCDSHSRACSRWQVRFVSLSNHETVKTLCFASRAVRLEASTRFVIVGRIDCITVLAAPTLSECFTIPCVNPSIWTAVISKCVPFSLGHRWLAFSDPKPIIPHLSRCGDASSDESEPLTSTVLNMNKRIWSGLSALANTVVPAPQTGHQRDPVRPVPGGPGPPIEPLAASSRTSSTHSTSPTTGSPGYVTVVDLVTLYDRFAALSKLDASSCTVDLSLGTRSSKSESCSRFAGNDLVSCDSDQVLSGTIYVNVHDYCRSGAVVAHFMAHRWATVALLKLDPTGSLLFTACARGHTFNIFRLSSHPFDERQTAVHHLYILERGTIPCEVIDAAFSWDSRWLSVSTNHGTAHVFPITPYGGAVTVRTHTRPYVVNRTSRYHRSSGLEEHHLTRPQPERGSNDSLLTTSGAAPSDHISSVRVLPGTASFLSRGGMCRSAPIAGLSPQCPHLGVPTRTSPINCGSYFVAESGDTENSSTNLPSTTLQTIPVIIDGACACPLNAVYTTTNPRLPPYPEPCQLKPEARLRPHNSGNSTTGAAAAALGVATGALEVVTASTCGISAPKHPAQMSCCSSSGLYYHSGPCVHFTDSSSSSPLSNPQHRTYSQSEALVFPSSGTILTTCFAPPLYFLPDKPLHRTSLVLHGRDPYASKARTVDGLFALTPDLHLVEYNLHVGPAVSKSYGEKPYQEGSLRVECSPIGEWNLRTDSICVPPFPKYHPFRSGCSDPNSINTDIVIEHDLTAQSSHLTGTSSNAIEVGANTAAAPDGWSAEDAASYWYSQVEITTHLGPLRRVWMGPQFTFRSLSKLFESGDSPISLLLKEDESAAISVAPIELPFSSDVCKLLPACIEPAILSSYYGCGRSMDPEPFGVFCGGSERTCASSRSSFRGTTMPLPESYIDGSTPYLKASPNAYTPRLPTGRLLDGASPGSPARWRTRSGEPSRPLSISGVSGSCGENTDLAVFIEGGSYPDSSLGGSLSSLVSRGGDDVASCIADAIQDEDVYSPLDRTHLDNAPDIAHSSVASSTGATVHLGLRISQINSIPAFHSVSLPLSNVPTESALSEADFPSHEGSPHRRSALPVALHSDADLKPTSAEVPTTLNSGCDRQFLLTSEDEKCSSSHFDCRNEHYFFKPSRRSKKLMHTTELTAMRRKTCAGSTPELTNAVTDSADEGFCRSSPISLTNLFSPIADSRNFVDGESLNLFTNDHCNRPPMTQASDPLPLVIAHELEVASSSEHCSS